MESSLAAQRDRILAATLADLGRVADEVARLDAGREVASFSVGDGRAIFLGPRVFVNRLIGLGHSAPVDSVELGRFEYRASLLDQTPEVDVSIHADSGLVPLLVQRDYLADDASTSILGLSLDAAQHPAQVESYRIEIVTDETLGQWHEATAVGWGHINADARSGSDLYANAAFAAQDPGLILARSIEDDRVVGCAALAIVGNVAILGGMSTLPLERRRGVQTALIQWRITRALAAGCDLAATQAETGSGSHRNLERHGFVEVDRVVSWTQAHPT